jgi:hypothetical protein
VEGAEFSRAAKQEKRSGALSPKDVSQKICIPSAAKALILLRILWNGASRSLSKLLNP